MTLDIKNRITLLLVISVFVVAVCIGTLLQYKIIQEKRFIDASQAKFENEIASIVKLKGESLYQVSYDYTYWDDFVENIQLKDENWFETNINTIIESFYFDYVSVYDDTYKSIYRSNSDLFDQSVEIPISVIERLKNDNFDHFFIRTDYGYLELRGASVHPTFDSGRNLTEPSGYFYVGKLWNKEFIDELGVLSGSAAHISHDISHQISNHNYTLALNIDLLDWNGDHLSHVYFERTDMAMVLFDQTILYTIIVFVVILLLIVFGSYFMLDQWVSKPLSRIMDVLRNDKHSEIEIIKNYPGEFSQIGILLDHHLNQKEELVIAKDKAEESDRLKTEFLSNLSHEIRTPMNGILGFTDLMREPGLLEDDRQLYVGIIEKSVNRLLKIINNLIDISKIQSGFVALNFDTRNIFEYLTHFVSQHQNEASQKGLELVIDFQLHDKLKTISSDFAKLDTILLNLIKNALAYSDKGKVKIGCQLNNNSYVFFVSDNGIGIPREKQQIIFDRFVKGDSSLTNNTEGSGLGLAITKAYVEMLGGQIWVESEVDFGSTFYFSIPLEIRKAA
jgi:signal transduction histidine kinase